jgi:uncharacterized protein (DUF1800 family)
MASLNRTVFSSRAPARVEIDLLIRRATFGPDGEIESVAGTLGWDAFVEQQLHPETIDDRAHEAQLAELPSLSMNAFENCTSYLGPAYQQRYAMLLRATYSKRQLFERAVAFWNDHFSIDQTVGMCPTLKTIEDRTAIRAHALGRFRDLLEAVTKSAAMMDYLNNRTNRVEAPNENFARELLELHSLGVGEYGERDVKEVARCFTGWTIRMSADASLGEYLFDASTHDDGEKTVLGVTIPAGGGEKDGHLVLDLVAKHPATARRLARKLCSRFVSEDPSDEAIEAAARVYLDTDGDLREVLRSVLRRDNFVRESPSGTTERVAGDKFLRPLYMVVALLRATDPKIERKNGLLGEILNLGEDPFSWPTPDGYPDRRIWWESSLLARWAFVEKYMHNGIDGVSIDASALLAGATTADVVDRIDEFLTAGRLNDDDRRTLQRHADSFAKLDDAALRRLMTLAACAPSAQEM